MPTLREQPMQSDSRFLTGLAMCLLLIPVGERAMASDEGVEAKNKGVIQAAFNACGMEREAFRFVDA